jgi:hypothetical protein
VPEYRYRFNKLETNKWGELSNPIATAPEGGSVQQGLSSAGGALGFFQHHSAADKRYSLGVKLRMSRPSSIPADPTLWSEKSKQSYSYHYVREYTDINYKCWHCQSVCIFTAQDQKYTFEVKKASINQRRILCSSCWSEAHRIRRELHACEATWQASKVSTQTDKVFLSHWLDLLTQLESYVPYKPDAARKNMLGKFIADA